jgi:hypothetical protein
MQERVRVNAAHAHGPNGSKEEGVQVLGGRIYVNMRIKK